MSDQPAAPDLGELYAAARQRITQLVADVDPATPVPATPEWTVHDVVAHLSGVVEDALAGNMEGAPGPAWTAAQVTRRRPMSLAELLEDWTTRAPAFEGFLSSPAGASVSAAVFDVSTHECDLRGALGLPADPHESVAAFMASAMVGAIVGRSADAGLAPLRVVTIEGDAAGPDDAPVRLEISRHELLRAAFGRRSPEQLGAYAWVGDPTPYLAHVAVFGPRQSPLVD